MTHTSLRVKLPDGSSWPDPRHVADLEWRLRHGEPTRGDVLDAASVLLDYRLLCNVPSMARKLPMLRRVMRATKGEGG